MTSATRRRVLRHFAPGVFLVVLLTGCVASPPSASPSTPAPTAASAAPTGSASSSPSPEPSPSASASPASPSARPSPSPTAGPAFHLEVVPAEEPVAVRTAIPGDVVVFLLRLIDTDPAAGPVSLTAIASHASVTLSSEEIRPGLIVEASVTPYGVETDSTVLVILKGERLRTGVRFELWAFPTGRTVTFSAPTIRNYRHAVTYYVHTSALRDGTSRRIEYTVDGFEAWVTRWVRDTSGRAIHHETFFSHYARINGTVLIGDHNARYVPVPPHAPGG